MIVKKYNRLSRTILVIVLLLLISTTSFLALGNNSLAEENFTFKDYISQPYSNYTMSNSSSSYGTFCVNLGIIGISGDYVRIPNPTGANTSQYTSYMNITADQLAQIRYAIAETRTLYDFRGYITSERITSRLPLESRSRTIGSALTQNLIWNKLHESNPSKYPSPYPSYLNPAFTPAEKAYFYGPSTGLPSGANGAIQLSAPANRYDQQLGTNKFGPFKLDWSAATPNAIKEINRDGVSKNIEPKFVITPPGIYTIHRKSDGALVPEITLGEEFYIQFPTAARQASMTISPKAGTIVTGIKDENLFTRGTVQQPQYNLEFNTFSPFNLLEFDLTIPTQPNINKTVTRFNGSSITGTYSNYIELDENEKALFKIEAENPDSSENAFHIGERDITEIYTARQLQQIGKNADTLSKNYKLMNNIDMSVYIAGVGWNQIGTSAQKFTGSLDGNGYSILNFSATAPMFYGNDTTATFKNITFRDSLVGVLGGAYGGTLSVGAYRLENCHVFNGRVSSEGATARTSNIGGLVSNVGNGGIKGCSFYGFFRADYDSAKSAFAIGGIAGISTGNIEDCRVYNTFYIGSILYSGGIVARLPMAGVSVTNCKVDNFSISKEATTSTSNVIGGIVGEATAGGIIIGNCSATQFTITSMGTTFATGGIIGYSAGASGNPNLISNCNVSGSSGITVEYAGWDLGSGVGGIIGTAQYTNIKQCSSDIDVRLNDEKGGTGGILGSALEGVDYIEDCSVMKRVGCSSSSGLNRDRGGIGGIAGSIFGTRVSRCYMYGEVYYGGFNAFNDTKYIGIGGIVGCLTYVAAPNGIIENCFFVGNYRVFTFTTNTFGIGRIGGRLDIATYTNNYAHNLSQAQNNYSANLSSSPSTNNQHGGNMAPGASDINFKPTSSSNNYSSAGWNFTTIWMVDGPANYPKLRNAGTSVATAAPTLAGKTRSGEMYVILDKFFTSMSDSGTLVSLSDLLDSSLNPLTNKVVDVAGNGKLTFYYLTNNLSAGTYLNTASVEDNSSTATVVVKEREVQKFKINLIKTVNDGTGTYLDGAVFKLYKYNTDSFTGSRTLVKTLTPLAANNGDITGDLEYGYYFLEETTTPTGYTAGNDIYLIVRSEGIEVSYTPADPTSFKILDLNVLDRIAILEVGNTVIPPTDPEKPAPKIAIEKYGSGDTATTALANSSFTLHKHSGDFTTPTDIIGLPLTPGISGSAAVAAVSGELMMGNYTLMETASPTGYVLPTGNIRISVDSEGDITVTVNGAITYVTSYDTTNNVMTIKINNDKSQDSKSGKIKFTKEIYNNDNTLVATNDDFTAAGLIPNKNFSFDIKIEKVDNPSIWYLARIYRFNETVIEGIPIGKYKITELNRVPFEFVSFTKLSGSNIDFELTSGSYYIDVKDPSSGTAEISIRVRNKITTTGFRDEDEKENLFKSPTSSTP